jgi:hypothetical protein
VPRRALGANHARVGAWRLSSSPDGAADAIGVLRPRSLLSHPRALIITTLAASDLAYRLLLRESLRRALGVETRVPGTLSETSARHSAGARRLGD